MIPSWTFLFTGAAGGFVGSLWKARKLRRCTSCEPRCPNAHRNEIDGCVWMAIVWIAFAAGALGGVVFS